MADFYCAAPWRGLHINFRGDVKTCCAGNPNMLGNLNTNSITNIIYGEKLKEIRSSIKNGIPHEYCSNCVNAEKLGGRSERLWHNTVNSEFNVIQAEIDEYIPTLIDVRWNITCNLSCNYCSPSCSSKWAALKKESYKAGVRSYYDQVHTYLKTHRNAIREVALVGGEPLLLPENDFLLDILPDDCLITLITNMTADFQQNTIVKKLASRPKVGWSMSFENIGERFEYVRYGATWSRVIENVKTVNEYRQAGHYGGIHAVYNLYSATRLREIGQYARQVGLDILWQPLYDPSYLNVCGHSQRVKQLCLDEIEAYCQEFTLSPSEKTFFPTIKEQIKNSDDTNQGIKLKAHISIIENKYHPDKKGKFVELWPELSFLYE